MSKKNKAESRAKAASKTPRRSTARPRVAARPVAPVVAAAEAVQAPVVESAVAVIDVVPVAEATESVEVIEAVAAAETAAPAGTDIAASTPAVDIAALTLQLRDGCADRAAYAAEQLGGSADADAVAPLLEALASVDGYFHVVTRAAAAMALGRLGAIGGQAAVDALLAATGDAMAEVSAEAVLALGELRATAATPLVIDDVENRSGFYVNSVRHAALRALGRIGDARARDAIVVVAGNTWEDRAILLAADDALAVL
jgi:HEAT repeat protein